MVTGIKHLRGLKRHYKEVVQVYANLRFLFDFIDKWWKLWKKKAISFKNYNFILFFVLENLNYRYKNWENLKTPNPTSSSVQVNKIQENINYDMKLNDRIMCPICP